MIVCLYSRDSACRIGRGKIIDLGALNSAQQVGYIKGDSGGVAHYGISDRNGEPWCRVNVNGNSSVNAMVAERDASVSRIVKPVAEVIRYSLYHIGGVDKLVDDSSTHWYVRRSGLYSQYSGLPYMWW